MCHIVDEKRQLEANTYHITNAIVSNYQSIINRESISRDVGYLLYLGYSLYRTMDIVNKAILGGKR